MRKRAERIFRDMHEMKPEIPIGPKDEIRVGVLRAGLNAAVREEREKREKAIAILQGAICPQGVLTGADCENRHWVGNGTGYKECRTTENHCHFYLREPRPDDIVDGALAALLTEETSAERK